MKSTNYEVLPVYNCLHSPIIPYTINLSHYYRVSQPIISRSDKLEYNFIYFNLLFLLKKK